MEMNEEEVWTLLDDLPLRVYEKLEDEQYIRW